MQYAEMLMSKDHHGSGPAKIIVVDEVVTKLRQEKERATWLLQCPILNKNNSLKSGKVNFGRQ